MVRSLFLRLQVWYNILLPKVKSFFPASLHLDVDGLARVSMLSGRIVSASFLSPHPPLCRVRLSKSLIPDRLDFLGGCRRKPWQKGLWSPREEEWRAKASRILLKHEMAWQLSVRELRFFFLKTLSLTKWVCVLSITEHDILKKVFPWEFPLWLSGNEPNWYPWDCRFNPWPCSVG